MTDVRIYLLGAPRVEAGGESVDFDTRKATALLAYLVVTDARHTRDDLATLFWPESDQRRARANLRRTLSTLNTSPLGAWIEADREFIALHPDDDLWIDVVAFRYCLSECAGHAHPEDEVCSNCLPLLHEATELHRDDFLAGFTLRDSPEFDDWQFFEADSLRRALASALDRLVQSYSSQAQYEPAIGYARRRLALDPLEESAHRELIRLYGEAGEYAAALQQYRECVRILDEELGVPPLEATTQLYEAIREQPSRRASAPTDAEIDKLTSRTPPKPELVSSPALPLVGRSAEWDVLAKAYNAIGHDGRFIVVEGEAGVGKTRLAEEFLAYVRDTGATVVAGRCYQGQTNLAYGPLVDGLRSIVGDPMARERLARAPAMWLSETARLLPELAQLRPDLPAPLPMEGPGARSRFFEGVRQTLHALSGGPAPGILFLDDLHWADGATIELLTYLVRRLHGWPAGVLVTWRDASADTYDRLNQMLAEARRVDRATKLSLARLSRADVATLARSVDVGTTPTDTLGDELYQETEGLPFFVVEYLTLMATRPAQPDPDWPLPHGVRDMLRSRLAGVSDVSRQVLQAAATIGRSFDFDTVRQASGRSEEETITALEALTARRLVEEARSATASSGYDFSHAKLRALVYAEMSQARRRLLHRRVADALAGRHAGRADDQTPAAQIAQHYQLAGNEAEAAAYYRQAGEQARAVYANRDALSHFRAALAMGHPAVAELHAAIGDLHTLLGEYSAAITAYETAAASADIAGLALLEHKLGTVCQRRGEWELAESHFQAAVDALAPEAGSGLQARVYADWSLAARQRGEMDRAQDLAELAHQTAQTAQDERALAQTHNTLAILARDCQQLGDARRHLEQSLALAESLGDVNARIAALNNLALVHGDAGDTDRALALVETAIDACRSLGDFHREAALHNNLADLLHAVGRTDEAMEHLKRAAVIFAEIGRDGDDWQPEVWNLVEW